MGNRHFPNEMPSFVEEDEAGADSGSGLHHLLSLPYPKLAVKLLGVALNLKQKVVEETWVRKRREEDGYTLYAGLLGTAFLLFKAYQVTDDRNDLSLCAEIIKACDSASTDSPNVTFVCGRAGVCALGAVVAKLSGDEDMLNYYLSLFNDIRMPDQVPNELLYGRAGYLWSCSFLNKHLGDRTIPSTKIDAVVKEVISDGKRLSVEGSCPLMYEWFDERYWGAAHGLAGIVHVLMDMELNLEEQECVKGTLRYMIENRLPSGNYPLTEGDGADGAVHWCHGAPGVALTLTKAYQVFQEEEFLQAAAEAAEVVWNRGLLKRVGICHGISGNAYAFLSLYRLTGNAEHLYRAKAFACFLLDGAEQLIAEGILGVGDQPFSLFEGQAGWVYFFLDMLKPPESRFPAYEL
ncbi:lanC-like protein GCL2 [Ananas comosus]|uniref:LanC-like protein GCL2 n=1 Tax=Ananas comosus TaxID=4615 RepID=A0A6P5FCI2_ANACO|nr:lanC-like protein GCL2 [Ananas comosus]